MYGVYWSYRYVYDVVLHCTLKAFEAPSLRLLAPRAACSPCSARSRSSRQTSSWHRQAFRIAAAKHISGPNWSKLARNSINFHRFHFVSCSSSPSAFSAGIDRAGNFAAGGLKLTRFPPDPRFQALRMEGFQGISHRGWRREYVAEGFEDGTDRDAIEPR